MYTIYTLILALASLFYLPAFALRMWRGRYPVALAERLGRVRARPEGSGPRLWLHAVSVGEVMAAVPLIQALQLRWPHLDLVISTTTATGARVAQDRLSGVVGPVMFPLDLPPVIRRVLNALRPDAFVAMETELWPNLLRTLRRQGIPAMIANGRISDRSFRRYRWIRFFLRPLLGSIAVFGMQSEEDARRIISLGASPEKVHVTGNLKMESSVTEEGVERLWTRLLGLDEEPVWVAGSTHQGEEEILLDVYQGLGGSHPSVVLILVPRHPERVSDVEALVRSRGISSVRRSALPAQPRPAGAVILVDTVGELASLYSVADLVFMGGSLIPWGGQNMVEPALRGKPVLFGPHVENFRDAARLLLNARGAIQVRDGNELLAALRLLLDNPTERTRMGEVAREAVAGQGGACQKTLDLMAQFLFRDLAPSLVSDKSPSV